MTTTGPSGTADLVRHKFVVSALAADIEQARSAGRVFVDFDHTLFLWNSTEALLDGTRPSGLAAPLLKLVSGLVPWRLLGAQVKFVWRDFFRILMTALLSFWTFSRFRKQGPALFRAHLNRTIASQLAEFDPERVVIVSFGLRSNIEALLAGHPLARAQVIAPTLLEMPSARKMGKVEFLRQAGIEVDPATDVVITDSAKDDADLLAATAHGHVIQWPGNRETGAHAGSYVPFLYTAKIKRSPGFLIKQVFLEEMLIVFLMFAALDAALALPVFLLIFLLFVSYMLVYEIGYAENDRVGEQTEQRPKLSRAYFETPRLRMEPDAWIWAIGAAVFAFACVPESLRHAMVARFAVPAGSGLLIEVAALSAIWTAFLILSRGIFWVFNHVPLAMRVFAYLPLHATKYFGLLLFLPIHPAGVALGFAQIVRTWAMYAIRRAGGDEHLIASQATRLCFLIMFSVVIFSVVRLSQQEAILLAVAFAFCLVRAIPEARRKIFGRQRDLELAPKG